VRQVAASPRGDARLVEAVMRGSIDDAHERVGPLQDAVAATDRAHPQARIGQAGDASLALAAEEQVQRDFARAELSAVPLTFAILLVVFGALVAAVIPLALGLTAVASAIGLLSLFSGLVPLEESVNSVVLLIGLAVGVDYSLFYLRRAREERAAGRSNEAALEAAARTSGHSVIVSAATVVAAVSGMFLFDSVWYRSYAAGIVVVVVIAAVGSLTVLPALLSWLGDRVERGRIPFVSRRDAREPARAWGWILDRVLRRPAVSAALATGLLLALAAPTLGMHLAEQGLDSMPRDLAEAQAGKRMQERFDGGSMPAVAVVSGGDMRSGQGARALERLRAEVASHERLGGRAQVELSADGHVARVLVPLPGSGVDDRSERALAALTEDVLPAAVGRQGLDAAVTGPTAASVALREQTTGRGPWIIALVLALSFVVLMLAFRSVVVPAKAVALNLLSVGAATGVLVLVFQHGWFDSLLGFEATGSISAWVPVLNFLLLFGLSMDYHVFILSRIREGVDAGMDTTAAVRFGIRSTAGVVTSAALVMVGVFSIFATLSMIEVKQIGVGLAVAVLLDATLVRAVLLPATMTMLGERNWWAPAFLRRRLGGAVPEPAAA
jgi:RND superfamily putative drug exporter